MSVFTVCEICCFCQLDDGGWSLTSTLSNMYWTNWKLTKNNWAHCKGLYLNILGDFMNTDLFVVVLIFFHTDLTRMLWNCRLSTILINADLLRHLTVWSFKPCSLTKLPEDDDEDEMRFVTRSYESGDIALIPRGTHSNTVIWTMFSLQLTPEIQKVTSERKVYK